jgi:hypothetical protein
MSTWLKHSVQCYMAVSFIFAPLFLKRSTDIPTCVAVVWDPHERTEASRFVALRSIDISEHKLIEEHKTLQFFASTTCIGCYNLERVNECLHMAIPR